MAKLKKDVSGPLRAERVEAHVLLDPFAHGPLLDMLERFRGQLFKTAATIAGNQPIDANHLEEAYQILVRRDPSADWPTTNRRRLYLIEKEISGKITPAELAELGDLQADADRHMREVAPRPLEILWDLRERLRGKAEGIEEDRNRP